MKTAALFLSLVVSDAFVLRTGKTTRISSSQPHFAKKTSDEIPTNEVDVIVIGSGLAGLSCAALLSHCDKETVVFEAHDTPGGAVSRKSILVIWEDCILRHPFFDEHDH